MNPIDKAILACLRSFASGGARSYHIANRFGVTTRSIYRGLRRLEATGLVEHDPQYSAVNDIYWRPCKETDH